MSLEFNRRSFLKYTAVAAVAVAGSSLLSGCDSEYQKTGTIGSKLKLMGNHTLAGGNYAPTFTVSTTSADGKSKTGTVVCNLTHECTSKEKPNSLCVDETCYELTVYDGSSKKTFVDYTTRSMKIDHPKYDLKKDDGERDFKLTIYNVVVKNGDYVDLKYWPRKVPSEGQYAYTGVYCTWKMIAKVDTAGNVTFEKR